MNKNTPQQNVEHPAQQALTALAEGGVEFDIQALLRSAPASPLSKEAAVLILFGVLDNSPSTGEFEGCPVSVSVVDRNESALIARVPVRDLLNPANRHTAYVKRGRTSHRTPAFDVRMPGGEEFTVWGFTAILLDRIFDSLGWTVPWNRKDLRPAPGYKP